MSVSGKTASPWEEPYYLGTDHPPDMAEVTKALAEKTHANLVTVAAKVFGSSQLKPTVGVLASSGSASLGTSAADVSGVSVEITPTVASNLLVVIVPNFFVEGVGAAAEAILNVDASQQSRRARLSSAGGTATEATVCQVFDIALTAAKHTIKLQALKTSGTGAIGAGSSMLYALFAS